MLSITTRGAHFLEDSAHDLCLHGDIRVAFGERVLAETECTLSGAALYLLRALERDHLPDATVGEKLLPCCANSMYAPDSPELDAVVFGCPHGTDLWIRHEDGAVHITPPKQEPVVVSEADWRVAVEGLADQVAAAYAAAPDRIRPDEEHDAAGWDAMCAEWLRRRGAPLA